MSLFEIAYRVGRDAPMEMQSLGWALLICGGWALCWAVAGWVNGR